MLVVVSVPVVLQNSRYLVGGEVVVEALWVRYVVVVGDASVLRHLLMVGGEEQVCLVVVAEIGAEHRVVEVRRALVLVVATAVYVVEYEAYAQPLASVHAKLGVQVVLTVGSVSCRIVGYVGDGRQRVEEVERADGLYEEVVRLREQELLGGHAVYEYAVYAWRTEVAGSVVFTLQTCGEYRVHEHV